MDEISLDELIGNLQIYELRKNSQMEEEIKKDRGLTLKAMGSDHSDLNEEEMALVTRKFKKILKKVRKSIKKESTSKARNSDQDQAFGCFKCGKHDHIVKYCPMQKEEQVLE